KLGGLHIPCGPRWREASMDKRLETTIRRLRRMAGAILAGAVVTACGGGSGPARDDSLEAAEAARPQTVLQAVPAAPAAETTTAATRATTSCRAPTRSGASRAT